jgi:hypothetical protein
MLISGHNILDCVVGIRSTGRRWRGVQTTSDRQMVGLIRVALSAAEARIAAVTWNLITSSAVPGCRLARGLQHPLGLDFRIDNLEEAGDLMKSNANLRHVDMFTEAAH